MNYIQHMYHDEMKKSEHFFAYAVYGFALKNYIFVEGRLE